MFQPFLSLQFVFSALHQTVCWVHLTENNRALHASKRSVVSIWVKEFFPLRLYICECVFFLPLQSPLTDDSRLSQKQTELVTDSEQVSVKSRFQFTMHVVIRTKFRLHRHVWLFIRVCVCVCARVCVCVCARVCVCGAKSEKAISVM